MKLLIQPEAGPEALLQAIKSARKTIEIAIFRFDRSELEAALKTAIGRGVAVSALIAYTNRGGEVGLRKLEMRLLKVGAAVSRTAHDLVRYHDKLLVIDRRKMFVLSYNFTHLDIDHSRGFGLVTTNPGLVKDGVKLFEADTTRTAFTPVSKDFVVSPINARKVLTAFIRKARKQLLIYDPKISDSTMLRALAERKKAGVKIRVIGSVGKQNPGLDVRPLTRLRLHTRAIIRDGSRAFVGSQSLRRAELDSRRELGLVVRASGVVRGMIKTFEADWEASTEKAQRRTAGAMKATRRAVEGLVKGLSPLSPVVKRAIKDAESDKGNKNLDAREMKDAVKDAVREAIRERVDEVVTEAEES